MVEHEKIGRARDILNENNQKALKNFAVHSLIGALSSIIRPIININNFEIKPVIFQMIQTSIHFKGFPNDNPNAYLSNFVLEICDTFKQNSISSDALRHRLFSSLLRDKTKSWLHSLPASTITKWEDLTQNFFDKFFPPVKATRMRNNITNFY